MRDLERREAFEGSGPKRDGLTSQGMEVTR
jgi:hypothetical protein